MGKYGEDDAPMTSRKSLESIRTHVTLSIYPLANTLLAGSNKLIDVFNDIRRLIQGLREQLVCCNITKFSFSHLCLIPRLTTFEISFSLNDLWAIFPAVALLWPMCGYKCTCLANIITTKQNSIFA